MNDCHRLGPKQRQNRPVIVQFNWKEDRDKVWANKSKLAGTKIYISEHFCQETEENRKILYPYVKAARIARKEHSFFKDKIRIGDKVYTKNNLYDIPEDVKPENTATLADDKTIVFHGRDTYLSNWYNAPFQVNSIKYETNEQYYFSMLADHFEDDITAAKVREEKDPAKCKSLGKRIKGYKYEEAERISRKILLDANKFKFDQHQDLATMLFATNTKKLGEVTKDKVWGIGLSMWDKDVLNCAKWTGQNRQGGILEEIREIIKTKREEA